MLYIFWGQWSRDLDDNKRPKSHSETCIENSQSRSWLLDRINLEPKIADILTKRRFSRDEWNHLLCLFNIMSFSTYSGRPFVKFFLSNQTARRDWCHVETGDRTQPRVMGPPVERMSRHKNQDLQSIRWMTRTGRELIQPQETGGSSSSNVEVEGSQVYRQEMGNLAARRKNSHKCYVLSGFWQKQCNGECSWHRRWKQFIRLGPDLL